MTNTASSVARSQKEPRDWWREKSVWVMLFLGFSAGIPILLIFASLSLWLREAGLERSTVTYFSWAVLGYSFKFLWAPLVDRLPIPLLSRILGRRRAWMLVSQIAVIASIVMMGISDPSVNPEYLAWAAVLLGFSSATQDIVIDAYRIEIADVSHQGMLAAMYTAGYRTGMIVSGGGALLLAQWLGSSAEHYSLVAWQYTYYAMAGAMLVGVFTTLVIAEPKQSIDKHTFATRDYLQFLLVFLVSLALVVLFFRHTPDTPEYFAGYAQTLWRFVWLALELFVALAVAYGFVKLCNYLGWINRKMVYGGYQAPIQDFFTRYGKLAIWILLLIGFYRISDIVLGVISYVFYQDMGYSKTQIALISKGFGLGVTIFGSFLGGILALRIGVMRTLLLVAILVVLANLTFLWLANVPAKSEYLIAVIIVDNLTQGLSMVALIAWMSSLTNVQFTATQYAIFSSLMTLFPKFLGGFSGAIVDSIGYTHFFLFASALGVPIIALVYFLGKKLQSNIGEARH